MKSGSCVRCVACALFLLTVIGTDSRETFSFGGTAEAAKALVRTTILQERYVLRRRIKAGGMGMVYEAWDINCSRLVAIKFMHPHLVRCDRLRARFLREQAAQVRLCHPNLLPAYDVGEDPELGLFIVMPLVGQSLRDRLAAQSAADELLDVRFAVEILRDIASALAHLHELAIVHRDLKPSNVLLTTSGNPVALLIDYGVIAVPVPAEERLTAVGNIVGTSGYMSPEQACGERNIGCKSDLFALGLVAWECLCGSPVYLNVASRPGGTQCRPLSVCALRPVPQELSDLIDELMLDPDQRPNSAETVVRLNQILQQLAS